MGASPVQEPIPDYRSNQPSSTSPTPPLDIEELGLLQGDEEGLWLWEVHPECSLDILTEEEERWAREHGLLAGHEAQGIQEALWLWEVVPVCLDILTEEEERWARERGLLAGEPDLLKP